MGDYLSLILGLVAVSFFIYLCVPSSTTSTESGEGRSSRSERKLRARQISGATGVMGGSIEDAFVSKHALDRAHGAATDASVRDVAASVALQQQMRPPE